MSRPRGSVFCRCLGLKTGIDFPHFGLESGMVLEGTMRWYERSFFQFQMNNKKRVISGLKQDLKKSFCLTSVLSYKVMMT